MLACVSAATADEIKWDFAKITKNSISVTEGKEVFIDTARTVKTEASSLTATFKYKTSSEVSFDGTRFAFPKSNAGVVELKNEVPDSNYIKVTVPAGYLMAVNWKPNGSSKNGYSTLGVYVDDKESVFTSTDNKNAHTDTVYDNTASNKAKEVYVYQKKFTAYAHAIYYITLSSDPLDHSVAKEYTTYCSDKALFISDKANISAYTATCNSETGIITLKEIKTIPANTGVVLWTGKAISEALTVTGVFTTTTTEKVENNDLIGTTSAITVNKDAGEGKYNYVLYNGKFMTPNSKGTSVGANRAYLQTTYNASSTSAKSLKMVFEGQEDATAISEVKATTSNGKVYNLQGMEVKNPASGLYIKNGKKIVVR